MKSVTGEDSVNWSKARGDARVDEFRTALWIVSNHPLLITEDAMRQRLVHLEFTQTLPERNRDQAEAELQHLKEAFVSYLVAVLLGEDPEEEHGGNSDSV